MQMSPRFNRVLRVLDQRWTAVDNALEMPFAERVRAATVPVKYASKFGSSEATVAPHVLMRGGVESFDHFMRLEVGDMTPRDTGANKWAYDPRYNRALRRPDGVYNTKPRPQRVAPASQRRVATASRVNKLPRSPRLPHLWRPRRRRPHPPRRRWTRSDEGRTDFLPSTRAQKSFPPLDNLDDSS